ncbi:hypothetical protein EDF76_1848 [Raoultella terrigena]|nr:hypothetical protein EDF76_1848 [Raoultella terrigena]
MSIHEFDRDETFNQRLLQEFYDSYDEELEMELDDKKKARLNCISHLLQQIPYTEGDGSVITLPQRKRNPEYHRNPVPDNMIVPEIY